MNIFSQLLHNSNNASTPLPGSFPQDSFIPEGGQTLDFSANGENDRSQHGLFKSLLRLPFIIAYYVLKSIIHIFSLIGPLNILGGFYQRKHKKLPGYPTRLNYLLEILSNESDLHQIPGTSSLSQHVTQSFGSLYGLESGILSSEIVQGSYTELLEIINEQCKFAIIYLHSPLLDDNSQYLNQVLCTEDYVNTITKFQCMIWFNDVTCSEGLQVSNALKISEFPFLGVLSLNSSSKVELIYRLEGPLKTYSPSALYNTLSNEHSNLIQLRQMRQNVALQRIIREQQDSRYQESLRRDQETDRTRETQRVYEANLQLIQIQKRDWLFWKRTQLLPEPNNSENVCRVAIRLIDGTRLVRRFDPSLLIEEIYAYVELYINDLLPVMGEAYEEVTSPPGYQHKYDFLLISSVPRRELNPPSRISEENSIYPSGNIVMENLY